MQIASFLRKQDSLNAWIENHPLAARAAVEGDHATWLLSGVSVPGEYTMFVSHFPGRVPVERRKACATAITRANSRLGLGAFELNLDNGLLIFRTAIPSTTREIDPLGLGWMLAIHQDVVDHYFEALMSVIYGTVDPGAAIRRAEGTCSTPHQPDEIPHSDSVSNLGA
jgi:hypothetical protein